MSESSPAPEIVQLSGKKFIAGCLIASAAIVAFGPIPAWTIAVQVFLTIIALFVLGSIKYQLDKNALTYGAILIIAATFWGNWWPSSGLKSSLEIEGAGALFAFAGRHLLTLHGLDELFHADTMLFILGLTFFVAVIAQTRILESASFSLLKKNKGWVVPTVAMIAALVSFSSGILDGVSMIGLMIRTLVIILILANAETGDILYAVMLSTVVTTVCGMWLAYGEPPNLIMKTNLHPHLDDAFFLRYCLPAAVGSYMLVYLNLRKKLKGKKVEIHNLDVLDLHTADVRFLQASRHGEVITPVECVLEFRDLLGTHFEAVSEKVHHGEPVGAAMLRERVPEKIRLEILGHFTAEDLAQALDDHYQHVVKDHAQGKDQTLQKIRDVLKVMQKDRMRAQKIGFLSFIPFVGFLVWHAVNHQVPLFLASFAGFFAALIGIFAVPKMRNLALREARHEFSEYLFLLPLFLSITLLQKTGFFDQVSGLLHAGIEKIGASHIAYLQFTGAAFLSAILDNNVVADFASRALRELPIQILHLFAMAQIAGYAVGGCWTHIGCAQSVVSYAFIRKEIDEHFTPVQWIKAMTPLILEIFALMTLIVYGEAFLFHFFAGW